MLELIIFLVVLEILTHIRIGKPYIDVTDMSETRKGVVKFMVENGVYDDKGTYVTVVGCREYIGNPGEFSKDKLSPDTIVHLRKEPDNQYDKHAIAVYTDELGMIGYIANKEKTAYDGTKTADRVYNKFGQTTDGAVCFVDGGRIVCELTAKVFTKDKIEKVDIYDHGKKVN